MLDYLTLLVIKNSYQLMILVGGVSTTHQRSLTNLQLTKVVR